jgi:hypothetical protein
MFRGFFVGAEGGQPIFNRISDFIHGSSMVQFRGQHKYQEGTSLVEKKAARTEQKQNQSSNHHQQHQSA